ncbi:MarR family winged helix-turn-helix transcriptional regulator [Kitasatospora misakiensis]|uniref:MarR family winged helix-turn-helix transcriptional regulator n=1 Tax=Kitasatospora misakiensis TaxID=67330 RepID=A0ABW0XCU5_9ACTN
MSRDHQQDVTPGYELPLRLLLAFRTIIDELHERLAGEGHPELRPMHGFVFQAIGPDGTTAVELGRRLGVSKQAAGKTVEQLERLGYVERGSDPADARRKVVRLTARGVDCLVRSARIFEELRREWVGQLGGEEELRGLEDALRVLAPGDPFRLDTPRWLGTT